jgi:hypothetical protein
MKLTLIGNEDCDRFMKFFEKHPYKQPGDYAREKLIEMMKIEEKREKLCLRK